MLKMRFWGRFLFIAALLSPAVSGAHAQERPMSLDEEYAQMAEKVPGFGGLYVDEQGTTHVYLQNLARAGEMQGISGRVKYQQGEYDFRDLYAWKGQIRQQLAVPGAVFLDIDEKRNRIVIGVERGAMDKFTWGLHRFLKSTRMPPEAVIVEPAEPIRPLELLTDRVRPIAGGFQIQSSTGTCTLGVNATRLGVRGFVTNSHCTATRGVVDGTTFNQSVIGLFNRIGVETVDPPFFTGGSCPAGRKCRWSDAAFVAYDSTGLSAGGYIANPAFWGLSSGTTDVNPSTPRLPVTGTLFGSVSTGSVVYKVGRTTGGTFGSVTSTCVDTNVGGTSITMLCQDWSSAGAGAGDSGSPVFTLSGGEATIAGVLWGGGSSGYVYSPWLFVFSELGASIVPDAP
jgi:hypothetical protein